MPLVEVESPERLPATPEGKVGGLVPVEHDQTVDYDVGAPFTTQVGLMRQSNPAEAKAYLEKLYGKDNFGQDKFGNWWAYQDVPKGFDLWKHASEKQKKLKPGEASPGIDPSEWIKAGSERRKVAVFPKGFGREIMADMAASAPTQAGAIIGGELASPLGPVGVVGGTALGAIFGKAADEAAKYYQGTYRKTPAELELELGKEGLLQGGMAAAGPIGRGIVSTGEKVVRKFAGVTPETKALGQKLMNDTWIHPQTGERMVGVIPPFGSVATKARALEYDRFIRNLLSGDPKDPARTQYMLSRIQRFLVEDLKLPKDVVDQAMVDIVDKSVAIGGERPVAALDARVQEHIGSLRASAESNIGLADQQLSTVESAMRQWSSNLDADLPKDVTDTVVRKRREWGRQMQSAYDDIHEMLGGEKVVDKEPVVAVAQALREELTAANVPVPPRVAQLAGASRTGTEVDPSSVVQADAAGEIVQRLSTEKTDDKWTVKEAHQLRTELRALAENMLAQNPTMPGPAWRKIQDLAGSVDVAIQGLEDNSELGSDVVRALKKVDKSYRDGSARFNDAQVQKLVTMVRRQLPPDPETIVDAIFVPGKTQVAKEVWGMLAPELRDRVQKVQMRNLLNSHTNRDGLDASGLLDTLTDPMQRRLLEVSMPSQDLTALEYMARGMSALDLMTGDLGKAQRAIASMPDGALKNRMLSVLGNQLQIEEFAKIHPLAAFMSGKPDRKAAGMLQIIEPGAKTGTRMRDTFQWLGMDSEAVADIRRFALERVLNRVIRETPTKEKRVSGAAIINEISAYTKDQQELLFPGTIDNLKELAKDARFLFPVEVGPEGAELAQSLGAASIQSNLPKIGAIKRFLWKHVAGWIADRPSVINMLVDLKQNDPTAAAQLRKWIYRWAVESQTTGPGRGSPKPEPMGTPG